MTSSEDEYWLQEPHGSSDAADEGNDVKSVSSGCLGKVSREPNATFRKQVGYKKMLTIVVPVYRQWQMVEKLLECLRGQTLPVDRFRIVLVNNEQDFDASGFVKGNVEVLECRTPGSYAARNLAVDRWIDETHWFVFTDADCQPENDWLEQLLAAIDDCGDDLGLISGNVVMVPSEPHPGWAEIYDLVKGIPQREYAGRGFGATANLAVAADIFRHIGAFDAAAFSGGDRLFCLKARRHGYALKYHPLARVHHPARSGFDEVFRKTCRVRGGQIIRSRGWKRWARVAYALAPPLLPLKRLWCRRDQPRRYRLIAVVIQCRLWMAEMPEIYRILKGGPAERR